MVQQGRRQRAGIVVALLDLKEAQTLLVGRRYIDGANALLPHRTRRGEGRMNQHQFPEHKPTRRLIILRSTGGHPPGWRDQTPIQSRRAMERGGAGTWLRRVM